jgi:hypothetical protein
MECSMKQSHPVFRMAAHLAPLALKVRQALALEIASGCLGRSRRGAAAAKASCAVLTSSVLHMTSQAAPQYSSDGVHGN